MAAVTAVLVVTAMVGAGGERLVDRLGGQLDVGRVRPVLVLLVLSHRSSWSGLTTGVRTPVVGSGPPCPGGV